MFACLFFCLFCFFPSSALGGLHDCSKGGDTKRQRTKADTVAAGRFNHKNTQNVQSPCEGEGFSIRAAKQNGYRYVYFSTRLTFFCEQTIITYSRKNKNTHTHSLLSYTPLPQTRITSKFCKERRLTFFHKLKNLAKRKRIHQYTHTHTHTYTDLSYVYYSTTVTEHVSYYEVI